MANTAAALLDVQVTGNGAPHLVHAVTPKDPPVRVLLGEAAATGGDRRVGDYVLLSSDRVE
jgi:hypothetical protein